MYFQINEDVNGQYLQTKLVKLRNIEIKYITNATCLEQRTIELSKHKIFPLIRLTGPQSITYK